MINIALCESNDIFRNILINMLEKIKCIRSFSVFSPPADGRFVSYMEKSSPDIILIDENFKTRYSSSGSETLKFLKENHCCARFIYLSSSPEHFKGRLYNLLLSDCILKPANFNDVQKSVLSAIKEISPYEEIKFRCSRSEISLNPDDILYFEAEKRNTGIRTSEKSYISTETISSIYERLPENSFFRTHRTYVLNFRHIAYMENDLVKMKNGEFVLLSRHRRKEFESAMEKYKKIKLHKDLL